MKDKIIFLTGPTGIGKSTLAINLSKKINGEIINADSMQIYKELKILTARPNEDDIKKIKHHLYGYVKGNQRYNVEKWCLDATNVINLLIKKKVTPIIVGGTGLYINTLINGIIDIPSAPESIKKDTSDLFNKLGSNKFYELVKEADNDSVLNISKNDSQRLKRIWEVYNFTNKKLSEWKQNNNKKFLNNKNNKIFLFLPNRNENYERVNNRVYNMIENGCIDEVKKLLEFNFEDNFPIMRAHGVPEISQYLEKKISLEECIRKIQLVTRHYVKRQNTWWRSSNLEISRKFNQFPDEIDINATNFA